MKRGVTGKRPSRFSYKAAMAALIAVIVGLSAAILITISSVNSIADEYNFYIRQRNVAASEKNMDEKTRNKYAEVVDKESLVKDLKRIVAERASRREELKSSATDQNNIAAEAEVRMAQYMKECGFSSYEELLEAYNRILTEAD